MENKVLFKEEARAKVKEGVDLVANPVRVTLGAKGRNVMCVRDGMLPIVTKDGVSIAKEVQSEDPIVNAGCLMVKQVAMQTNDLAGDGTTTSTVMAQAIVERANKAIEKGCNEISLKRGIDKATEEAVKVLKTLSQKSSSLKTLKNIALISANGEKEIADLVVSAIKKVGKDGGIKVEEHESLTSQVDTVEGYELDSPFSSWGYITNPERMEADFKDMNVLLYEGYLENFSQLDKVIEICMKEGKDGNLRFSSLLVIADQISPNVEKQILIFKSQGMKFMNVKSPSFGTRRKEVLKDIACLIGAKVYSQDNGDKLEDIQKEDLGYVERVISDANKTLLIGGAGDKAKIKERLSVANLQSKTIAGGKKEKDFVRERISKLSSGVAVINVGGNSEVEKTEKSHRVEDALCAVRACMEEGFVAGGGVTYLLLSEALKKSEILPNKDEQIGYMVLVDSLSAPFRQIMENAGTESESFEKEIRTARYGTGYNLRTEKISDLIEDGVIDPAKVSRLALQNASSIAGTYLTIGSVVYNNTPIIGGK